MLNYMDKYEIIDFLEWAKENRHLEFPESRKVNMAEAYLELQNQALPQADVIKEEIKQHAKDFCDKWLPKWEKYCDVCKGCNCKNNDTCIHCGCQF